MGDVEYEPSVVDEGLIVKQSISGGESVDKNTEISFVVSSGDKKVDENGDNNSENNDNPDENKIKEKTLSYSYEEGSNASSIRVVEGGNTIYEGLAEPSKGDFKLNVKGSGQKKYEIYVNGEYVETQVIDFN